ncbi:MAG: hypothetical protein DSY43_02675 [Gammaproteobacteria bacterium]|nr:MAG: hypothetical protein DSY43_02675 [Gammaproteobacteria bacterium]
MMIQHLQEYLWTHRRGRIPSQVCCPSLCMKYKSQHEMDMLKEHSLLSMEASYIFHADCLDQADSLFNFNFLFLFLYGEGQLP